MRTLQIIATAYNEKNCNRPFYMAMLNQTCKDYNTIVWHNGPYHEGGLPDGTSNQSGTIMFRQSSTDTGNWGAANRQQAIDECTTDYIIQTSVQDYWLPQAIEYIQKALDTDPDLVIWDSINHLVGPCRVLDCQLAWSKLDWGNFAIRTNIAKQVKIKQTEYCSDWLFIKECLDRKLIDEKKIVKIKGILTIHN